MPMTKVCTKCGVEKELGEFSRNKGGKYGVRADCKYCRKQYYQENRGRMLEYRKEYYQENRSEVIRYGKRYYQENREKRVEYNKHYGRQYRQDNRERVLECQKQYRQENPEIFRAGNAKYRAKKRNATPDWLTPIDHLVIRHIYKTCPEGHHVDHVVPLKGETVSGLHVPWNLQHLPAAENISKGNREWPDMWFLEEEVA
jgi:hypothetical protein